MNYLSKNHSKFVLLLLSILFISSCSKVQEEISKTDTDKTNPKEEVNYTFKSELGISHNGYLDAVAQLPSFPNHTYSDLYSLSVTYFPDIHSDSNNIVYGINSYSNYSNWLGLIDGFANYEECIIYLENNSTLFSVHFYSKLRELDQIINSDSTITRLATNRLTDVLAELNNFYIEIENSSLLSNNEKIGLQENVEIAYYSMMYWYEVSINQNNPWYKPTFSQFDNAKLPDWLKKAGKIVLKVSLDAGGFTLGFGLGSGLGAPGGPAASVAAGTAGGTLLGTAASSLIK